MLDIILAPMRHRNVAGFLGAPIAARTLAETLRRLLLTKDAIEIVAVLFTRRP